MKPKCSRCGALGVVLVLGTTTRCLPCCAREKEDARRATVEVLRRLEEVRAKRA